MSSFVPFKEEISRKMTSDQIRESFSKEMGEIIIVGYSPDDLQKLLRSIISLSELGLTEEVKKLVNMAHNLVNK